MTGQALPLSVGTTDVSALESTFTVDNQEVLALKPGLGSRAARGAVTGIVLGAGLWVGIIAGLVAVFKH